MFFKKLEFLSLSLWNTPKFFIKHIITGISHLFAITLCGALILNLGILVRSVFFSLSFFFIAYWTISIFIYLYKKSQYGVFTRIIQRFWKRALWLFWLIELFLFFIYLFLTLISPQEVSYMLDNTQIILDYSLNLKSFFINTFNALIIILLINIQILLHKTNTLRQIISAFITFFLLKAVIEDFLQFYAINNFYNSFSWNHVRLDTPSENLAVYKTPAIAVWELETVELKTRTLCHYLYLLIFLKLWHTIFIFTVFIFLENISLRTQSSSYNIIAANLQNFYFLMFFNYILKITLLKSYLNYLGTYVFYWFFVNYNCYDFGYFYELFNLSYFFFLWNDLF